MRQWSHQARTPRPQPRQDTTKVPLPPVAGSIFIAIGTPRTYHHGPLLTRPAQVERLDLECDRDVETGHVGRCYQPHKES
jgi:hypothetical protein